jgi:hypothetical protein
MARGGGDAMTREVQAERVLQRKLHWMCAPDSRKRSKELQKSQDRFLL